MSSQKIFDPRKMMEKAIEVMRLSIHEQRKDAKASPLVGAVLVKPDGNIETACRGELREGDHAEFTLLERKNRANKLDGSVLFATLEPCAPGARNHPKLSCAERIANARIKEVWIGIEDPDPTVDRKGIKFLQDHGVVVHMFDRDLQEQIQTVNEKFFEQALERKAAAEEDKIVTLSELEHSEATANLSDFSSEALDRYQLLAGTADGINSQAFHRRLIQMGLLQEVKQKLVPTGFGMLLFGKSPRDIFHQAGLLGTIHYDDGSEEVRDFNGPMVLVPGQVLDWLKDKLPNPINRSAAQRKDAGEKFHELVREGVVNALVHRNYDIAGAKCQLTVTPDTVTITSPGEPPLPVTIEQMRRFEAPMLSRNPLLHYVFSKMKLAEERGLGLKTMRSRASDMGLPLPKYDWNDPYLTLTLYRSAKSAARALGKAITDVLSTEEQKGWEFISGLSDVTQNEYALHMGVTARTAQRHLKHFVDLGLLNRVGSGPATKYSKS